MLEQFSQRPGSGLTAPPIPHREIEFLKKETTQRRVLEESELAHKEEIDKLQEKVGTKDQDPGFP